MSARQSRDETYIAGDTSGFGTRDESTMTAYAYGASAVELRAVKAEAERDNDFALVRVIDAELKRRGL